MQRLRGGLLPCAIIVDAIMPELDGCDFVAALRSDHALTAIPVVMISGHPDHVARAIALGVRSCFPKPVEPEVVMQAVAHHCRHPATVAES